MISLTHELNVAKGRCDEHKTNCQFAQITDILIQRMKQLVERWTERFSFENGSYTLMTIHKSPFKIIQYDSIRFESIQDHSKRFIASQINSKWFKTISKLFSKKNRTLV